MWVTRTKEVGKKIIRMQVRVGMLEGEERRIRIEAGGKDVGW